MRHASLLLAATLLAACQVAPPLAPAQRAGELRPVADGVSVTGRIAFPARFALKTPPQTQRTAASVQSLEVYVRTESPNATYRLLTNGCNGGDPNGTLWTSATVTGTPPATLTLTGLPRDMRVYVTLVARDQQNQIISCHDDSVTQFLTTAESLQGSAITFRVKLMDTGEVYQDGRPVDLQTPGPNGGGLLRPSAAPVAVRPTVRPAPAASGWVVTTLTSAVDTYGTDYQPTKVALDENGYHFWLSGQGSDGYLTVYNAGSPIRVTLGDGEGYPGLSSDLVVAGTDAWAMVPGAGGEAVLKKVDLDLNVMTASTPLSGLTGKAMVAANGYLYVVGVDNGNWKVKEIDTQTITATDLAFPPLNDTTDAVSVGGLIYGVTSTGGLYSQDPTSFTIPPMTLLPGGGSTSYTAVGYDSLAQRLVAFDATTRSFYTIDPTSQPIVPQLWIGPGDGTAATSSNQAYATTYAAADARFINVRAIVEDPSIIGELVVVDEGHDGLPRIRRLHQVAQ